MASIKAGVQLASVACATKVVVVRTDDRAGELTCGGHVMVEVSDAASPSQALRPGHDAGTTIGKRYVNGASTIEVLCARAGEGSLAFDGELLEIKDAKPLPSSD